MSVTSLLGRLSAASALVLAGGVIVSPPASAVVPANDNFASATPIGYGIFNADNTDATMEGAEAQPTCVFEPGAAEASVWYRFTAPETGDVRMDTLASASEDTEITVYTGATLASLMEVGCSEDADADAANFRSDLTVPVAAAQQYYVRVTTWTDGDVQSRGGLTLNVALYVPPVAPANDDFEAAAPAMVGQTEGTNLAATTQTGEPEASCLVDPGWVTGASVWYGFTAPSDATMSFGTSASPSPFDSVVTVYTGNSLGALTEVACDDEGGPNSTSIAYADVTTGTAYWVRVAGWALESGAEPATGDFVLTIAEGTPPPPGPANDSAEFAEQIFPGTIDGTTVGATTDDTDQLVNSITGCVIEDSIWYFYQPESDGNATVDLSGSDFDTALGYIELSQDGTEILGADCDESSGAGPNAALNFPVVAGRPYYFQVGSTVGEEGAVTLELTGPGGGGGDGDPRVTGKAAKAPGTQISYTVNVKTDDTGGMQGGTLTVDPPSGVKVGAVSEGDLLCASGTPIVCEVPSMGSSQTLSMSLLVTPKSEGPFTLDASFEPNNVPRALLNGSRGTTLRVDDPGNNTTSIVASRSVVCDNTATAKANKASGSADGDILCGLGGADVLKGLGGNDLMFGGSGGDTLVGGGGKDKLFGAGGNDSLVGGAGNDKLNGGGGKDRCREASDTQTSCER